MTADTRTNSNGSNRNRLYRSGDRGVIAGVCAGAAEYFGVDVTVTRLLVVIGAFFFPIVVVAYIVLAFLLPKRMDLRGDDEGRDGELRRRVWAEPHATLDSVRYRFRELDRRLQRLEKHVTSDRFKLDREFEGLKD